MLLRLCSGRSITFVSELGSFGFHLFESKLKSFDDCRFGNDRRGFPTTAQDWGLSRNVNVLSVSCVDALVTAMCVVVTVSYMCCVLWFSVFELPPLRTNKSARIYKTVEQGSSFCNILQRH